MNIDTALAGMKRQKGRFACKTIGVLKNKRMQFRLGSHACER